MILLPQTPPLVKLAPSIVLLPTQGAPEPKDPLRVFQSIGGIDAGALEACKKGGFNVSKQKEVSARMKTLGLATPEKGGRWPIGTFLAVGKSLGVAYVAGWTDANAFAQKIVVTEKVINKVKIPIKADGEAVVARWTLCEIASGKVVASFVERKAEFRVSILESLSDELPPIAAGKRFAESWTAQGLKAILKTHRGS